MSRMRTAMESEPIKYRKGTLIANMFLIILTITYAALAKEVRYAYLAIFVGVVLSAIFVVLVYGYLKWLKKKVESRTTEVEEISGELKDLLKMTTGVLSKVARELRAPLTIIKNSIELVMMEEDPKERQALLEMAKTAVIKQTHLTENLIRYIKLEEGEMPSEFKPLDLNGIVGMVVAEMTPIAMKKEIDIRVKLPQNIPPLTGNATEISQVLFNLIENAIKFSMSEREVEIKGVRKGKSFMITISDNGIGIAGPELERIFDRFYQVSTTMSGYRGIGIGLAISKNIIEAHKGKIWAESKKGEGSKFTFTLPIATKEKEG